VAGGPWLGELVAAQGLAGRPGGIQGVGLGAVAAGGPLGPVQLHHLFVVGGQEPGQPGAVATGALDRPDPPTILSVGEPQQLLVAGWGGGTVTCSITAPVAATTTAAVWVCLWVSTPMTTSTSSASMALR
jgi:hypothetical protein